ncbi:MAG: hypothetical protein ACI8QZ_002436 [Chlamydiales bacterium]
MRLPLGRNRGASIPILPILILLVAGLTYAFGWKVPAIVAALVAAITLGVAIHDRLTHATKCRYCNKIKARLAPERGIEIARISTVHEVPHDDYMEIRVSIDGKRDILVAIDFNEEILDWPAAS